MNEQVKRNANRFPGDFIFQLTEPEKQEVVAKCDHLKELEQAKQEEVEFKERKRIGFKS
jgi:hypothetical protein